MVRSVSRRKVLSSPSALSTFPCDCHIFFPTTKIILFSFERAHEKVLDEHRWLGTISRDSFQWSWAHFSFNAIKSWLIFFWLVADLRKRAHSAFYDHKILFPSTFDFFFREGREPHFIISQKGGNMPPVKSTTTSNTSQIFQKGKLQTKTKQKILTDRPPIPNKEAQFNNTLLNAG